MGRRIAFAHDVGRIWAICDRCGEWNLAPIEDRWEAIQELEKLHDSSTERASASGVAVARSEQVELIRVGDASGLEFSSLRYAERLRDRDRRHANSRRIRLFLEGLSMVGAAIVGATLLGMGGIALGIFLPVIVWELAASVRNPVVAEVPLDDGQWVEVRRRELEDARLVPEDSGEWRLRIRRDLELRGQAAVEAARYLLPRLNWSREPGDLLRKAWNYIKKKGATTETVFAAASLRRGRRRTARLSKLDPHIRMALEIVAGSQVEHHAAAENLALLREAWRRADELAVIQDELVYTPRLLSRLRRLKD